MQEKVEIITNHIVHIWTILDKNTQKRILWGAEYSFYVKSIATYAPQFKWHNKSFLGSVTDEKLSLIIEF